MCCWPGHKRCHDGAPGTATLCWGLYPCSHYHRLKHKQSTSQNPYQQASYPCYSRGYLHCLWANGFSKSVPVNEACNNTRAGVLQACRVHREAAYLLLVMQYAFSILLLMVTHIDIPDTPCAVFRSCDHFGGIWRKCETQNLASVSLHFKEKPQCMLDCHS